MTLRQPAIRRIYFLEFHHIILELGLQFHWISSLSCMETLSSSQDFFTADDEDSPPDSYTEKWIAMQQTSIYQERNSLLNISMFSLYNRRSLCHALAGMSRQLHGVPYWYLAARSAWDALLGRQDLARSAVLGNSPVFAVQPSFINQCAASFVRPKLVNPARTSFCWANTCGRDESWRTRAAESWRTRDIRHAADTCRLGGQVEPFRRQPEGAVAVQQLVAWLPMGLNRPIAWLLGG